MILKTKNTKAYEDKTKIDIENINTIEKRNKLYTTQGRKIYKYIEPDYFRKIDIFQDGFIKICKDNANKYQFVPMDIKDNTNSITTEQRLYA